MGDGFENLPRGTGIGKHGRKLAFTGAVIIGPFSGIYSR
jgi:hypothetical protein